MKRRILVVEDEKHIADALALNLDIAGYQVVTAADGAAGYELAAEGAAVAVVDIDVGAGESTAELIRGDGGTAHFIEGDVSEERSWTRRP